MKKTLQFNVFNSGFFIMLALLFGTSDSWSQITYNYTGSVQTYVVPAGVNSINISASGAQGGGENGGGGLGALMSGDFTVTPGETLTIIVGQQGQLQIGGNTQNSSGGGGGTFVYNSSNTLLVAAGGGGGKCNYTGSVALHADAHGKTTTNGGNDSSGAFSGGTGGNGGAEGQWSASPCAGGGTGWLTDGGGPYGGLGITGSWAGGAPFCGGGGGGCGGYGGYGGGGGGGNHYGGGGGGGGYSGGAGGGDPDHGGGGGSYSIGTNQSNQAGVNTGNGMVVVTELCSALNPTVSATQVCEGEMVTLSATSSNGGTITWDNGVTDGVPFVPAVGTTTYTATSSDGGDCAYSVDITVDPAPSVSMGALSQVCVYDNAFQLVEGSPSGGTYSGDGVITSDVFDPGTAGVGTHYITYSITDAMNGCVGMDSTAIVVDACLELNELSSDIKVYPNPTTGIFNVQLEGEFDYQLFNSVGQLISEGEGVNAITIDLSSYAEGTYTIKFMNEEGIAVLPVTKY